MGFMTKVEGAVDRAQAKPGMAYFEGSGPPTVCGKCKFLVGDRRANLRCEKYKQLTKKQGAVIQKTYSACKFFEPAASRTPLQDYLSRSET